TMAYKAEAQIVREIGKFLINGGLYKGAKPVMWSVVEQTALAEAEIEYHDHTSTTVWARFPVVTPSRPEFAGSSVVIWTTTPWTLPGNRAIAYGADFDYVVATVGATKEGSLARPGEKLVVAAKLLAKLEEAAGFTAAPDPVAFKGTALAGTVARHPLAGQGYDFPVPLLEGDFVSDEDGSGFVHIAPGHGEDDFLLGVKYGVEVPQTVGPDGVYYPHVPL